MRLEVEDPVMGKRMCLHHDNTALTKLRILFDTALNKEISLSKAKQIHGLK